MNVLYVMFYIQPVKVGRLIRILVPYGTLIQGREYTFRTSHVARRTSHVARRTSHVARRTSHVARRTSHVNRNTHAAEHL